MWPTADAFGLLFNAFPHAYAILLPNSPVFTIVDVNEAYLRTTFKEREDLIGKGMFEVFPAPVKEDAVNDQLQLALMQVVTSKKAVDLPLNEYKLKIAESGKIVSRCWAINNTPLLSSNGELTYILHSSNDVTEYVELRKKFQESEQRLMLAIESAEVGIWELNLRTKETTCSATAKRILGNDTGNEWSINAFLKHVLPEDREDVVNALNKAENTGKLNIEVQIIRPDNLIRWIHISAKILKDQHRQPGRLLGTMLDITDSKQLERQREELLAIASHELKNPITTLKASLQILRRLTSKHADEHTLLVFLTRSLQQVNRLTSLVHDLLDNTRIQAGKLDMHMSLVNVKDIISNLKEVQYDHHEIVVHNSIREPIEADKNRLEQVLVNFLTNAVKYSPGKKSIALDVRREGEWVKFSVTDMGIGIPKEKVKHVFDRYFRVEEGTSKFSGLGLGLYISAEIIKQHQGVYGVESHEGKGSTFWFKIPIRQKR